MNRWTVAAVAALVICSISLVIGTIMEISLGLSASWLASWSIVYFIVIVLADLAMVFGKKAPAPRPRQSGPYGVYAVAKIDAMGPRDQALLRDAGVNVTDQLVQADLKVLSRETGIALKDLQRWRTTADLMAVKGIGPKWAQSLTDAGVTSIDQIAAMEPVNLAALLLKTPHPEGAQGATILERTVPQRASTLVRAARASLAGA